jgi:Family of unknown function (DUF6188)
MTQQWIEGCAVVRVMFRDGLVVNFDDDNELVIRVPLHLTVPPVGDYPAEVVPVDPNATPDEERPLFDIPGAVCTRAQWADEGDLHIEFSDGHAIDVPHDEHVTAWELYGKYHGYVASLPHGKLRVLRHDLLDEK